MDSHELISMESDRVTCIIVASTVQYKDLVVVENSRKSGPAFYSHQISTSESRELHVHCMYNKCIKSMRKYSVIY